MGMLVRDVLKVILEAAIDALAERLDAKLHEWTPKTATAVRQRVLEMIALADQDAPDVMRSRTVEQEVLDRFFA